ncbi:MAG: N-6 DNA methylase, partial [Melioribacteraceae bacterium]|nr:N-6 DNA methylase [Melioribacteraceae bacterium]
MNNITPLSPFASKKLIHYFNNTLESLYSGKHKMAIFQKSVINKYLSSLDKNLISEKFSNFQQFYGDSERVENIKLLKEENYQEGFLREIFVQVLGYTINPDKEYNLTTEYKNETDSKKADGAILSDGKAIAVIELKSTKTKSMESIQEQAFNYKNNQSNCKYVITSNFHKLRFYIDNATEYKEFDLFDINLEEFSVFYRLLSMDSIFNDIPTKLKADTKFHEENISDKFYKDYSSFKNKIFENLIQNNPTFNKLVLFKKSQKFLDRLLFVFFAEDNGLVPPNSISKIIEQWQHLHELEADQPLYNRYKLFFSHLNSGHKYPTYNLPAYNGGLFAPDDILDNIIIDDEILNADSLNLSSYDFNTDIDVNILGHIFEHSLSEIEEITSEIAATAATGGHVPLTTKRKKDGIFYTPKYITQYIVDNTIGTLCKEQKEQFQIDNIDVTISYRNADGKLSKIGQDLYNKLQEYKTWLLSLKILDPACGSGAFLNQALTFLIKEHNDIDEQIGELLNQPLYSPDNDISILENNIYGVDINDESVEIAKLSLWLRTAKNGRKLSNLSNNIKCGNSLIDDPLVAGDKAFNWNLEFSDIMKNGGFDVVIGNPPYVFARDKISQLEKKYYVRNYVSAQYQVNTYLLFIEQTINLLKDKAQFGLIVPNAWLMVSSASSLRKFILEKCKINEIVNLMGYSFAGVSVETIILNAKKERTENNDIKIFVSNGEVFEHSHDRNQNDFSQNSDYEFRVFSDDKSKLLIDKLCDNSEILDDLVFIKAGLKAYEKGKGEPKQTVEDVKNRPYDFEYKFDDSTYKYLDGKDVSRYFITWTNLFLKYGKHLAAPRTFNLFDGEKIILREITGKYPKSIIATHTEKTYLFNMSNIAILPKRDDIRLKYILVLLGSSLISYYFLKNTAKSVRKMFPKVILGDLRKFPIKVVSLQYQQPFIQKADLMLSLNKQLQAKKTTFLNRIKSNMAINKITKKLDSFFDYNFKT